MSRAPGMDSGQVGVAGVAVADEHAGEGGQHRTVVDRGGRAVIDVQQRQVLGSGNVYIGQGAGGAAGSLIGHVA